ncbi:MAG: nuclear transport factor 2 family protein [Symploca sp. SIO2C1]|nr:nuclear transport factor 2 family protein [Symploca sp. SIO2C1]
MRNPVSSLQRFSETLGAKVKSSSLNWSIFLFLAVGLTAGWSLKAQAESPDTAPAELKDALTQIDAAANSRNIEEVMEFYDADFRNSDGLTHTSMEEALTQFWERYPQLNYRTELQNWERDDDGIVAETVTYITGDQTDAGEMKLESILRSRQHFENQKIVEQEILAERTKLTSGVNPPTVDVNLPEQVRIGQQYNFDAIVQEPLGNQLLLGAAMEEPVNIERYTNPADFELELLPAGGIFKMGKATPEENQRWISAILIRGDGITMITQRLQFVKSLSAQY